MLMMSVTSYTFLLDESLQATGAVDEGVPVVPAIHVIWLDDSVTTCDGCSHQQLIMQSNQQ